MMGRHQGSSAIRNVYGDKEVGEQLCLLHKRRNVLSRLQDHRNYKELSDDVWRVYSSTTKEEFFRRHTALVRKWWKSEPESMEVFENIDDRMLTMYQFEEDTRYSIYTNNTMERYLRELRRRIRAIGSFETIKSADILLYGIIEYLNQCGGSDATNMDLDFTHFM